MTASEKYQAFKKTYEESRANMLKQSKDAFQEIAAEFFEKFPLVDSFGWNQFTPYWNDGDSCHFGVNSETYSIEINEYLEDEEEDDYDTGDASDRHKAREAASVLIGQFDAEILEDLYGDHCSITVFRDGRAVVSEYEHE